MQNHMTRTAILDATEAIMGEEGYAAVSSRKVASRAGLKSQLVHYYFKTMDDLFLAVMHRVEERHFERMAQAIASKAPLRALWEQSTDSTGPRLHTELVALATHREAFRNEISRSSARSRNLRLAVVSKALDQRGIEQTRLSPMVLSIFLEAISRLIMSDISLGIALGHREIVDFVESYITEVEVVVRRKSSKAKKVG